MDEDCVPAVFTELSQSMGPVPFKPLVHTWPTSSFAWTVTECPLPWLAVPVAPTFKRMKLNVWALVVARMRSITSGVQVLVSRVRLRQEAGQRPYKQRPFSPVRFLGPHSLSNPVEP